MDIKIVQVLKSDLSEVVSLQNKLSAGHDCPTGGYRERHYKKILKRGGLIFKAVDHDRIVGAMAIVHSASIPSDDKYDSLLRRAVKKDFLLVKQLFVDSEYGRRGIASRFYALLNRLNVNGQPIIASIVKYPQDNAGRNFHRKSGFHEFLKFTPIPERGSKIRLLSAWIYPATTSEKWQDDVRDDC